VGGNVEILYLVVTPGVSHKIFSMQGRFQKKNITRDIPKQPYFAAGNNYLTLFFTMVSLE
jgi:hypothetical protein